MKNSNNIYNNALNKLVKKEKKALSKINKTIKNKGSIKKCENLCITDYLANPSPQFLKDNRPYGPLTKPERDYMYNLCKKTMCNPKCDGYDFNGNVEKQNEYKKLIKNGFTKKYTTKQINALKKKGALSGCMYIADKDGFHKINGAQRFISKFHKFI
jgi:hypothetical protein